MVQASRREPSILDELFAAIADFRATGANEKQLCDQLTAMCWRIIRAQSDLHAGEMAQVQHMLDADPAIRAAPQVRHRLYELVQLATLAEPGFWADAVGGTPRPEPLAAYIDSLDREMQSGLNVTSAQSFRGIAEIAAGRYDAGIHWLCRANYAGNSGTVVTKLLSYSRGACQTDVVRAARLALPRNYIRSSFSFDAHEPCDRPILLCCGDGHYIERFLLRYCETISQWAPTDFGAFHLHVVETADRSAATDAAIGRAREVLPIPLRVSVERIAPIRDTRSYFAAARFWAARALLEHVEVPVLITDLDMALAAPVATFLAAAAGHEVAVRRGRGLSRIVPWLSVLAGTTWVEPTPTAREYLSMIEDTFLSIFSPVGLNWAIDQNIMSTCLVEFERRSAVVADISRFAGYRAFTVPRDLKPGSKARQNDVS